MMNTQPPFPLPPEHVPTAQRVAHEVLGFEIAAIELIYRRLQGTLLRKKAREEERRGRPLEPGELTGAGFGEADGPSDEDGLDSLSGILDAWALVDHAYRLRRVLAKTPGLKQNRPAVKTVTSALGRAEDFRHTVQHLDGELKNISETPLPARGFLGWIIVRDDGREESRVSLLGRIEVGAIANIVGPENAVREHPVGPIWLEVSGSLLDLSALCRAVGIFAKQLERATERAWKNGAPRPGRYIPVDVADSV